MGQLIELKAMVPMEMGQKRLDQVAVLLFSQHSRARLQTWIKSGELLVNDKSQKPKFKLKGGETLSIQAQIVTEDRWVAQDIPIDVVYEDEHIIVLNKPMNLVVHPAAGNRDGTLLNGLLFHYPEVADLPRAGIVHRLDKDTTGLMVVARSLEAHTSLVDQLQERVMGREYEAVVLGVMTGGGEICDPIGRHPTHRTKMAVNPTGKDAKTHYRLLKKFKHHTHIRLKLESGRTHQIRVHMSYLNYPLIGDQLYAGRFRLPQAITENLQETLRNFKRQALHAKALGLFHPITEKWMTWEVDLPQDIKDLLQTLASESPYEDF